MFNITENNFSSVAEHFATQFGENATLEYVGVAVFGMGIAA